MYVNALLIKYGKNENSKIRCRDTIFMLSIEESKIAYTKQVKEKNTSKFSV